MTRAIALALLCAIAPPVAAQTAVPASYQDPRIKVIDYDPAQTVELPAAVGYQVAVEFAHSEQVLNVAVGNSVSWQVSVNARRNLIFVKPAENARDTNMTVFTNLHTYTFELRALPTPTPDMAFTIRFRSERVNPASDARALIDIAASQRSASRYRLSGDGALRPDSVSHDSRFTYVTWPKNVDLPATYEISATGQELLVNGIMRDDVLVIDRVIGRLRFRRDSKMAQAEIVTARRKR
jgi:type IV secretion system protein VirB9